MVAGRQAAVFTPTPPVSSQSVAQASCTTRNPSLRYVLANPALKKVVPPPPFARMMVPLGVPTGKASLTVAVRSGTCGQATLTEVQAAPSVAPKGHVAAPSIV